jgi:hypothetical protein
VMFIVGVMMDEFVQARTDRQYRGPLEHGCQKYGSNGCLRGDSGRLPSKGLLGSPVLVHEAPDLRLV